MFTGPNIPRDFKYLWDFSNPKGINNIADAYGNEILTKTNLAPTNGAIISSGSGDLETNMLTVDGNNDECPTGIDISWNNTNDVSWGFWFKPDSSEASGGIIGKQDSLWEWSIYQSGTNLRLVYWNTSGGHTNGMDFSCDGIINNEWNFAGYTWKGSTEESKFYIYNSTYRNTPSTNTHTATDASLNQNRTNQFCMGGAIYTWSDKYWGGEIGPCYFYERQLNDQEMARLYNGTKLRYNL